MAVMQNMREYTKTILMILVLAFVGTIIFDWGMNFTGLRSARDTIGKVNGQKITYTQFQRAYQAQLEDFRNRTQNEPTPAQLEQIRNQTWDLLVQDYLIQQALAENEIHASDKEIVHILFNDPPELIKASFRNEQNQFDMASYKRWLNAGSPREHRTAEELVRQQLPRQKFQERLQASVRVTEDEVLREYLKNNQKVTVKYVFVDPNRFLGETPEITDEMIERYYKEHKEEYREPEKRRIDYVIFPTRPTASDSAAQRQLAQSLLERAREGEDFAALAQDYSQDPGTRDKGGDLGFFAKGAMVKPFEEAAFAAKVGEVVGPVETRFGLHIIKIEERKKENGKEQVRARHILLKFEASSETINSAREDALYLAEESPEVGFETLAREMNLEVKSSPYFPKGNGFVPVLGLNKKASEFIFSKPVGTIGGPEEFTEGFFVYRIADVEPEHIRPLSEVRSSIKTKLEQAHRMQRARDLAQAVYDRIQQGQTLTEAARQDTLEVKEASFTMGGFVPGVGREPSFIGAAFALNDSLRISKPVEATRGYYLLEFVKQDPFDKADFESKKASLAQQLLRRKQINTYTQWLSNAKANAKIEDYRYEFF